MDHLLVIKYDQHKCFQELLRGWDSFVFISPSPQRFTNSTDLCTSQLSTKITETCKCLVPVSVRVLKFCSSFCDHSAEFWQAAQEEVGLWRYMKGTVHFCIWLYRMLSMYVAGSFLDTHCQSTGIYLYDVSATHGYCFVTHSLESKYPALKLRKETTFVRISAFKTIVFISSSSKNSWKTTNDSILHKCYKVEKNEAIFPL